MPPDFIIWRQSPYLQTCHVVFIGCSDKKKERRQNQSVGNAVEFDDKGLENSTPCEMILHMTSKIPIMQAALR